MRNASMGSEGDVMGDESVIIDSEKAAKDDEAFAENLVKGT